MRGLGKKFWLAGLLFTGFFSLSVHAEYSKDLANFDLQANSWTSGEDLDQDCLPDAFEHSLARFYRPLFIFDSHENARTSREPVTLYRVYTPTPERCLQPGTRIRIKWGYLFERDGGYGPACIFCKHVNRHFGDNQAVDMELEVAANGKDIQPVRINIGNFEWPKVSAYFWNQRNPAIYLSSGKHHAYFSRSWDKKKSPYGKFCSDNVNGKGAIVLPTLEDPLVPRGRLNVGEPENHPRSSFVGDLSFAGFFYEDAWGKTPFCGGYQSSNCQDNSTMEALW